MKKIAFLFDKTNDWLSQYFPENLKSSSKFDVNFFYEEEKIRGFDLVFILGYTKVIKGEILSSNKLLLLVHESDLPKGRGFAPVQWQILEGKSDINICLIEISDKVDTGNIFGKMVLSLNGSELYEEIRQKQALVTFKLINKFLEKYPNLKSEKQRGKPTFYRRRNLSDSQLDLDKSIRDQFNLLRICNNKDWPAFFELNGVRYKIKIEKVD